MKSNYYSLFRHFAMERRKGKLTKEQLIDKWAYSQQITGIKPIPWRKTK